MSDLQVAKARLSQGFSFCIVRDGKVIFDSMSSGIRDIYHVVTEHDIRGSSIADKIIGKAVALLIVQAGVKSAFAMNINQSALDLLMSKGVEVEYDHIMDRLDSMCQFEKAVKDISDPMDAVSALRKFS